MNTKALRGKRVCIGLSGGVDSAVSAKLLMDMGAEVLGVFIQGWYPEGQPCSWREDRRDAMRVAAHLGIPFYTLDASHEYKKGVIDYLLREYKAGRTPNPDVMCNREVKFGAFYRFATSHGADYIATGHYATTARDSGVLAQGSDPTKDQSYFLWAVPTEVLAKTIFPLGAMEKSAVRALAKKFALPVSEKKDSQGICFLGSISVEEFLMQEIHPEEGVALSTSGAVVGTHAGSVLYTLGERVALTGALPGPWFVIAKDLAKNTITVSNTVHTSPLVGAITLSEENFFLTPTDTMQLKAQYRYHGPTITGHYKDHVFTPSVAHMGAIAPGQSLVLYQGTTCVGGGIIE